MAKKVDHEIGRRADHPKQSATKIRSIPIAIVEHRRIIS